MIHLWLTKYEKYIIEFERKIHLSLQFMALEYETGSMSCHKPLVKYLSHTQVIVAKTTK